MALSDRASSRMTAGICDRAALRASQATGVPIDVLRAVTRTETGRNAGGKLEPWPWTVNMEGAGRWFDTLDGARAYVFKHFKAGARSFDVGCFQINYRWHSKHFKSIDEMFDPNANAQYAATFLRALHDELGDWSRAAGAYHSRTPKYAKIYTARFDRIRADLREQPDPAPQLAGPIPLVSSGSGRLGSLVPLPSKSGGASSLAFFDEGN
ncbi:MAG: transglycosylase SLT domain-containing protein [Pseudomonadota bacterium]